MAKKKFTWKAWLLSFVDRKSVVTAIIIAALLGGFSLAAYTIVPAVWNRYWQRLETRTKVREEIRHRIPTAQDHIDDPNLAKKLIDGIDPHECLHAEFVSVTVQQLLEKWKSAGGDDVSGELFTLAATRKPTKEQMQELLALLTKEFDGKGNAPQATPAAPKPSPSAAPKTLPPPPKPLNPALQPATN